MKTLALSLFISLFSFHILAQAQVKIDPRYKPATTYHLKKHWKEHISTSHEFSDTIPEDILLTLKEITAGNDQLLFPGDNPEEMSLEMILTTGKTTKAENSFPIEIYVIKAESLPVDTIYPTWKISELQNRKILGHINSDSKIVFDSIDIPDAEQWERNFSLKMLSGYLEYNDLPSRIFSEGQTFVDTIVPPSLEDIPGRTKIIGFHLEKISGGKAYFSYTKDFIMPEEYISDGKYKPDFDDMLYAEYLSYDETEEGKLVYDIGNQMIEENLVHSSIFSKVLRLSMTTISTVKVKVDFTETRKILSPAELKATMAAIKL